MKINIRNAVAIGLLSVAGLSCSLKQNPFADESEAIKNGIPPKTQIEEQAKADPKDLLRIDVARNYEFVENNKGELIIAGRVLKKDKEKKDIDYDISIDNLSAFPGATQPDRVEEKTKEIDPVTQKEVEVVRVYWKWTWTPPQNFVADGKLYEVTQLNVVMSAKTTPVRTANETVQVLVHNATQAPTIVAVTHNFDTRIMREGERRRFSVTVKDVEAANTNEARPAMIALINNPVTSVGISHRVLQIDQSSSTGGVNPRQDTSDPSLWIFDMELNLEGIELTKSKSKVNFDLQAISRFGTRSARKLVELDVMTSVNAPTLSWLDAATAYAGVDNTIRFSVYEPNGNGITSGTFSNCATVLPGTSSCTCVPQSSFGAALCEIKWKPLPTTQLKTYEVLLNAEVKSPVPLDTMRVPRSFPIQIKLEAPVP